MTRMAVFAAKVLALAGAMVVAAWSSESIAPTYQGWVEANFVFIGPDETGRAGPRASECASQQSR
jgi:hypothetical protein